MKHTIEFSDEMIADLPVSPALTLERPIDADEDAIDWSEVGRLLYEREWGPILALPMKRSERFFWQRQIENGVDSSAFATIDFQRQSGYRWNPVRYKLEKLREQRQHVKWTLEIVLDRIKHPKKHAILRYIRDEVIEPDMCESIDMVLAARLYRRWLEFGKQIEVIQGARWER
jgi:hypothetical protein